MPRWTCLPLLLSFTALGCDPGPDRVLSPAPESNAPTLSIDTNASPAGDADRNGNGWVCGAIRLMTSPNGPDTYHDDKPDGSCPGGFTLEPVAG